MGPEMGFYVSHGSLADPNGHISMEKKAVLCSVPFFRLEFSSLEEDILIFSVVLQCNKKRNENLTLNLYHSTLICPGVGIYNSNRVQAVNTFFFISFLS